MIRWSVTTALKTRRVMAAVAAATLVVGVVHLRHAPTDTLPEFGPPIVEVDTEALGLSATEVEQLITVPLEQDLLDGVAWLAEIHSVSMPGLSRVTMVFEPGTDLLRARQVVQERISQAAGLPNVSSLPQMIQPESSTSRVMMIGLSSDEVSRIEMSVLARWTIRPRLLGVPGVANVSIWGQRERQLQVQVDPTLLRSAGVSLQQVISTAGNALWASPLTFLEANTPGTGGFVDTRNQRLSVQHQQPITTAEDLSRVPVEDRSGSSVRLGDVATVIEDHQPLIGDAVLTGGSGLLLVIEKFPGANTVEVTRGVEDALEALRPGLGGIRVDPTIYRPADYVEASTRNVGLAVGVGLLLAILAIGALSGGWRRAVIAAVGAAVALIAAALVLSAAHVSFDAMVLAGLVMGLAVIVDDIVTDLDTTRAAGEARNGPTSIVATIVHGARAMRSSLMFATLAIAASIVPLFFLRGAAGAFLPPLARAYAVAIAASMLTALIITPALASLLLRTTDVHREAPLAMRWLRDRYGSVVARLVRAPGVGVIVLVAVLALGLGAVPFLRRAPLPAIDGSDVLVAWTAPPGMSLQEMGRITGRVTDELEAVPGVGNVAAHVGRAVASDQAVDVDHGQIWISIEPGADRAATVDAIRGIVTGYPGMDARLLTYPNERVTNVLSDAGRPITVRVFGQDPAILAEEADRIRDAIAGVEGAVDPRTQLQPIEPTIDVAVDLDRAQAVGIKPGEVRRAAATVMSGIAVGSLFEEQKVFDVVVWGAPETRASIDSVRDLLIDTPSGGHVRLGDVASVEIVPTPTVIRHEDISRYLDVTIAVSGRSVGDVASDVEAIVAGTEYPLDYHAEVIRNDADAVRSAGRLLGVAVAIAIVLFLLLQAAFRSWRLALSSVLLLAVALAGGAIAALVTGRVVTIGSTAGFFLVLGLATRWIVVSGRHQQSLETQDGIPFGPELVRRGATERVEPIATSALAIVLLMLPFALAPGAAGLAILHPLSLVVIGGVLTSLIAALVGLPVLAARFGASPQPDLFEIALLDLTDDDVVDIRDLEPVSAGAAPPRAGASPPSPVAIDADGPNHGPRSMGDTDDA